MLHTMQKFSYYIIVGLVAVVLLCGCSLTKKKPVVDHLSHKNNQDIEQQLLDTAQSIERSLALLAMSQEANNPPLINTAPLLTPEGGMGGTADIDWTGPIEPLLRKLADLTDYKLKVLGSEPSIPIIVSITQTKAVIADIVKNASLQAGKQANIMIFPANKIIELRYRSG